MDENTRQLIGNAKNIAIIPSKEPEALACALALFYSIQESGRHATVMVDNLPEKLHFLIPSLDAIAAPKNFVISIPREHADIAQIHYEKTDSHLKIHFTASSGQLKKEDISFYREEPTPDAIIALDVADFKKHLERNLDASGFLLGAPVVSVKNDPSLTENVMHLAQSWGATSKDAANCLLAGLAIHYDMFKSFATRPETFQLAAELVKKGAQYHVVVENLSRSTDQELKFFSAILNNIRRHNHLSVATITASEFYHFSELDARQAAEKLRAIGAATDTLVLWQGHASEPAIKGFFISKNAATINKFAQYEHAGIRNGWVFINVPGASIESAADNIIKLLS